MMAHKTKEYTWHYYTHLSSSVQKLELWFVKTNKILNEVCAERIQELPLLPVGARVGTKVQVVEGERLMLE